MNSATACLPSLTERACLNELRKQHVRIAATAKPSNIRSHITFNYIRALTSIPRVAAHDPAPAIAHARWTRMHILELANAVVRVRKAARRHRQHRVDAAHRARDGRRRGDQHARVRAERRSTSAMADNKRQTTTETKARRNTAESRALRVGRGRDAGERIKTGATLEQHAALLLDRPGTTHARVLKGNARVSAVHVYVLQLAERTGVLGWSPRRVASSRACPARPCALGRASFSSCSRRPYAPLCRRQGP